MWIQRTIAPRLAQLAAQRPALVLTGARQTGKTALLRHQFPEHTFVSLDLPSAAREAETDPASFLSRYPPPVVVDEVQYAPGLFRHVKASIDADRGTNGRFILTGSQRFGLMHAVSDSLAGRVAVLELETLSVAEIRSVAPAASLETILLRGGYPELWAEPTLDARAFYNAYIATWLERDLRTLLRVASLRDFERFLRACALRSGQLLNQSDLARDVGVSGSTAREWLNALVATGVVALLEPWFRNQTKSLTKTPKLYFCDTGLLAALINLDPSTPQALHESPLRGALFETAAYCELRRALGLRDELASLSFYRDRDTEVDFVLHRAGRFELTECRWTEHPDRQDARGLHKAAERLGEDTIARRTIVCRTPHAFPLEPGLMAAPLETLSGAR